MTATPSTPAGRRCRLPWCIALGAAHAADSVARAAATAPIDVATGIAVCARRWLFPASAQQRGAETAIVGGDASGPRRLLLVRSLHLEPERVRLTRLSAVPSNVERWCDEAPPEWILASGTNGACRAAEWYTHACGIVHHQQPNWQPALHRKDRTAHACTPRCRWGWPPLVASCTARKFNRWHDSCRSTVRRGAARGRAGARARALDTGHARILRAR